MVDIKKGDTDLIIATCKELGLLRNKVAYVLATVWHETGGTMKPIVENLNYSAAGLLNTFPKYFTPDQAKTYARKPEMIANRAYANRIGNGPEASGDGWRYRGRGYVQITGKANYAKFGISEDQALDPDIAARVLVDGMKRGMFTGKKLADYITLSKSNFESARAIVNGSDKASLIAGYARNYDSILKSYGYGVEKTGAPMPVVANHPAVDDPGIEFPKKKTLLAAIVSLILKLIGKRA